MSLNLVGILINLYMIFDVIGGMFLLLLFFILMVKYFIMNCKLVRVFVGFEFVFWFLFFKVIGGGVVLMFKIYLRVYFEK